MLVRPGPSGPSGRAAQETPDAACDQALPEATTAVGTAVTDDGGPVILVALAHDSAAATQANADALERIATEGTSLLTQEPWSDLVTFDGVSVTGNDRVVLGRLRPREDGQAGIWFRLLMQGDSLVTSC
jgi:hypothetical protein